jgi:transcription elongation factor GreB
MSRAFLKESTLEEEAVIPVPLSLLPRGARNHMTLRGAERIRAELTLLIECERPALSALPQVEAETKRRRQILDRRIAYLQESLRTAEILGAPADEGQVNFGATVTVRDAQKTESTYYLVGVDETDPGRNWISWQAPLAKALWNARVGQRILFKSPSGPTELEIVRISYPHHMG